MKKWCEDYFRYKQNMIAFFITMLAAVILFVVLFVSPRPAMLDYGQYDTYLSEFGLKRTAYDEEHEEERYYTSVIETFDIEQIPWERLFLLKPTRSLVYPVSAVSIVCRILGIPFSVKWLSVLMAILLLASLYLLLKSLYVWLKGYTIAVGFLICGIFLCGNYLAPLNSLYSEGMFFVSFWMFAAALARGLALLEKKKISKRSIMLPLVITAFLFSMSIEQAAFLGLFTIGICIWVSICCTKKSKATVRYQICLVVSLLIILGSNFSFIRNKEAFSEVDLYHSMFDGLLMSVEEPEEVLESLGMEQQFLEDVGKSYFYPQDSYYVCPYDPEVNDRIYDKISYGKILAYYFSHPRTMAKAFRLTMSQVEGIDDSRIVYMTDEYDIQKGTIRNDWWSLVHSFMPDSILFYVIVLLLIFVEGCYQWFRKKNRKGILFWFLAFASAVLMLQSFLKSGSVDAGKNLYLFQIFFDVLLVMLFVCAIEKGSRCCQFLLYADFGVRKRPKEEYPPEVYTVCVPKEVKRCGRMVLQQAKAILDEERRFVWLSTAVVTLVMVWVLFFPRIGAYNNGDFGRMMDAMQLNYVPEDYYNQAEQYGTKVIENYDYREPYDWSIIRPSKLMLSQTYISALFRILYEMTGLPFSTVATAVLYTGILAICFYRLIKAAYHHGGRWALAVTVVFLLVFCGSSNLGWLNSLYGEGVGFVSLMMVVASSVHLLECRKGQVSGFLLYALSSIMLAGAKAQYALLLPLLLIWGVCLLWYHMPSSKGKRCRMCIAAFVTGGLLISGAVSVYRNNESISSQDTLYQGLCYGILMVAEDSEKALEELGLDAGLIEDAGKNAYLSPDKYYCAPRTEMAEELIYSKVSSVDYLLWYLRHPKALWKMMNVAAKASSDPMPDYILYVGEKTTEEHRVVHKLDFWATLREIITPSYFVEYIIFYGFIFIMCLKKIISRKTERIKKMYIGLFMLFMLSGILQYPLTVIGNGFADNSKQMYLFRVTFDGTLSVTVIVAAKYLMGRYTKKKGRILHEDQEKLV